MTARGNPILIDLGKSNVYRHEDMIGTVSALQVSSLAVEEMEEKDLLPEEIHFICRFKEGAMKVNQSV